MIVFLSYSHHQKRVAERIQLALVGLGHEVFFDREALPPGKEFHGPIRKEIEKSDAFVFLISPESVKDGSYARTELKFAREKWPNPKQNVFPVMVEYTPDSQIPSYLSTTITILKPEGDVAAEVAAAFEEWESDKAPASPAASSFAESFGRFLKGFSAAGQERQLSGYDATPAPARSSRLAEYLPGTWQLKLRYPDGYTGQATAEMYSNGAYRVRGTYRGGTYHIEGNWRVLQADEILLSGQQNDGYQITSFDRTIRFTQTTPNSLAGLMSSGEDLVWYRMA
jgi:hypothetical protein